MSNSESAFENYYQLANNAYEEYRYQEALGYFQKALQIGRKLKDCKSEAGVLTGIGVVYDELGSHEIALEYYEKSLGKYKDLKDIIGKGDTLSNMGIAYTDLGKFEKAIEYFKKSLVVYKNLEDKRNEADVLNNIGCAYSKLGKYDKAMGFYVKSIKIRRMLKDHKEEAGMLINIGRIYYDLCDYNKAIKYYNKSLVMCKELKDDDVECIALMNIGTVYHSWCKYDKAIEHYKKSLKMCKKLRDRKGEAGMINNIGMVYHAWCKYEVAIKYYDKSLAVCKDCKDRKGEGETLRNIGAVYAELGKYDNAMKYYEKSLLISKELRNRKNEAVIHNDIGRVYNSWGKCVDAVECYKKAFIINKKLKNRNFEGVLLNNIGGFYADLGKYTKAIKHFKKSLMLCQELRDPINESLALANIGRIYHILGKYDKAIGFYENCLVISMECKNPDMIYTISTNYAKVYEDYLNGESEYLNKAFDLYEKAIEASLFIKGNLKDITTREYFSAQHVDAFEGYIRTGHSLAEQSDDVAVKSDYYRKIFETAEKSKARTVVDLLANIKIKYKDKASGRLASELEEKERLFQQSCKKSEEYGFGTHLGIIRQAAPAYTPQLRESALEDCKKDADAFEKIAFADCAMRSPVIKSFNEILGVLKDDPDTIVLEYCEVGNEEYILYVLNYTGFLINPVRLKLPKINDALFELDGNKDKAELNDFFKEISIEGYSFTDLKGHYRFFQNSDEGVVFPTNILTGIEQLREHAEKLGMALPYNRFLEISQHYLDESLRKWGEVLLPNEVLDRIDEVCQASVKMPHLLIVPDALLYHIPFHALFVRNSDDNILPMKRANANNDKCYLIDKYDISYNVSMTVQWICRQEITPGRKEENYVYFGGADYSETQQLPSYEYEIGSIERRVNNRHGEKTASSRFSTFTGDNVTLKNFKDKSGKYTNHVVTVHGVFIPDAPMKSYFLFLDDKGDESRYTLEDMIGDEELIFKNSHLFWAGACKLGMSAATDGKDIIGLVRTLMQKGVPSVVMGLTNLDDTATALLFDNFCQVYDGRNKAKGLSEAVRQLRKCTLGDLAKKSGVSIDELKPYFNAQSDEFVFDNPYFWMPFVLYGDFR